MEKTIFTPHKRVFMVLIVVSALLSVLMLYLLWKVMLPGLNNISPYLSVLLGGIGACIAIALLAGVLGISISLLGIPVMKLFYIWGWKTINLLYPFAIGLGRLFGIPRIKIEDSFIAVSNHLVLRHGIKVPAERILILTPHCIQRDTCVHKITRNVENCRQCGGCCAGLMLGLAHKYGCKLAVATGGTLARQMVQQARPKAIVAVACERDLTSGIQDVFPLPVIGVLNERPFGPCFNTRVDMNRLEAAVQAFLSKEEINAINNKTN